MMNLLAIGLVLTSLLTAAVWSPSPSPTHHVNDDHREVIVKDGHRVVVVEYDKESAGSTKVVITPPDVAGAESKLSSDTNKPSTDGIFSGPRELVCDAYGKCKHKIASALGKTKDKVEETVHGVTGKAREVEEHAKDASEKVTGQTIGESLGKTKDTVTQGIGKAKKAVGDVADTVKDEAVKKVKSLDVVDSAKTMGGDIERNVTGKIEEVAKEAVAGEKSLGEILKKLKDVIYDVFWYMLSRDKVDAVVGLVHMLGYSTAYGMCVWVTFISSYILGRYLPRQQFGMVQSRIYPVYFKAMAYCISAALLGNLVSRKNGSLTGVIGFPGLSLLSALVMVLTNMIMLEPRATKTMYERMKIEKEEGRGIDGPTRTASLDGLADHGVAAMLRERTTRDRLADQAGATRVSPVPNVVAERQDILRLNEKLNRLNTYSSALNVSTLVALTWHMAYMGQRLHTSR